MSRFHTACSSLNALLISLPAVLGVAKSGQHVVELGLHGVVVLLDPVEDVVRHKPSPGENSGPRAAGFTALVVYSAGSIPASFAATANFSIAARSRHQRAQQPFHGYPTRRSEARLPPP